MLSTSRGWEFAVFLHPFPIAPAHRRWCLPLTMNWFGMNQPSNKNLNTFLHPLESCCFCYFNGSTLLLSSLPQISKLSTLDLPTNKTQILHCSFFFLIVSLTSNSWVISLVLHCKVLKLICYLLLPLGLTNLGFLNSLSIYNDIYRKTQNTVDWLCLNLPNTTQKD